MRLTVSGIFSILNKLSVTDQLLSIIYLLFTNYVLKTKNHSLELKESHISFFLFNFWRNKMEKEEENAVSLDDEPVINYRGITVMAFIIGKKENVIELLVFHCTHLFLFYNFIHE